MRDFMASCITRVAITLVACSPTAPTTTFTVDGGMVASCRAGQNARRDGIAVDIVLGVRDRPLPPIARLRFTRQHIYASQAPAGVDDGSELDCPRLERSWGGAMRPDGTGYWRGTLDFSCDLGAFATQVERITGRLDLVCGDPTAEEITGLDRQRGELRAGSGTGLVPR